MASSTLLIISLVCLLTVSAFDPRSLFRSQENNQPQNNQDSRSQDNHEYGKQEKYSKGDQGTTSYHPANNQDRNDHVNQDHYDHNNRGSQNTGRQGNQDSRNQDNYSSGKHDTRNNRDRTNNEDRDSYQQNNRGSQNTQYNQNNRDRTNNENRDSYQNNRGSQNTQYNQDSNTQDNGNGKQGGQTYDNQDSNSNSQVSSNTRAGESGSQDQGQGQGQESTTSKNILKKIGKGIEKEIQDIKQPVLAGVVSVASSQCDNLKKIAGVAYEQLDDEDEPDVSQLTLRFISGSYNITYNITTAARDIPSARNHDPSQRLFIFLHGFTDDPTKTSYNTIRTALFNEGASNVLGLDASSLIRWMYLRSTTYVQFIGEKLGEVLAAMVQGGVHRSNIHIIGHSLGAHIAGFTGKQFLRLTGTRVGRISGLDPAGPCFAHVNDSQRLNATDADFVDVIHTDSGVYGIKEAVGQVDYYPNEGKSQPGCFFETCSHSRAVQLFAASIQNPEAFPAVRCDSWEQFENGLCRNERSLMGLGSKPGTRGQFYLQTGSEAPFGKGDEGTVYRDKKGVVKTISKLLG